MKIVACVKQVPENTDVSVDPEHGRPDWASITGVMNPFDAYAVEQAVLLKEENGGEVIALTLGPEKSSEVLRDAIAGGADRSVQLLDQAFDLSDGWATSYILAAAIGKIGEVDLVVCGKQAIDGDGAQIAPFIAAHLGWPQLTYVSELRESSENTLTAMRMRDSGTELCEVDLPAVISVVKDINAPRIPSLRSRIAAKKAEIAIMNGSDLGVGAESVGSSGSPTKVLGVRKPEGRDKKSLRIQGEAIESASRIIEELRLRLK